MITIYQITNEEGRNEQFLPIFSFFSQNNLGKLIDNQYFIIESSKNVNPNDKISHLFHFLQLKLNRDGIHYVMYLLK